MKLICRLVLFCLCLICCTSCTQDVPMTETRSLVYTKECDYALPNGWQVQSLPDLSYDAHTDTISVSVYRDLEPLDDGFVPSEYETATLSHDGTLLSLTGHPEYGTASAAKSDYPPQLAGGIVQRVYPFNDRTVWDDCAVTVEHLYTEHDAELRLTLFDANANLLFSVCPADAFDYDLSRDIGAVTVGGDFFSVRDVLLVKRNDGTPIFCVLTTEGIVGYDTAGGILFTASNGNPTALIAIRTDANTGERIQNDPNAHFDTVFVLDETRGKQSLSVLDTMTGVLGDTVTLPSALTETTVGLRMYTGAGYDLYVKNMRGLYGVTLSREDAGFTASATMLADWALCDLASSDIDALAVINEDHFLVAMGDSLADENFSTLYRYAYVKPENVVPKQEIIVAKMTDDFNLQYAVRDFNKTSDTHKIVVRDYTEYPDADVRKRALDTDIASGKIPDIYIFPGYIEELQIIAYENTGLFCDLTSLLQTTADFPYAELLSHVTKPFQHTDGTQYRFPLAFNLTFTVGHASDFASTPTTEELLTFLESLPAARYATTRLSELRDLLIETALSESFDEERGTCSFDDGRLERVLTVYDALEEHMTYPDEDAPIEDLFKAGVLALYNLPILSAQMRKTLSMQLGEDAIILGAPNDTGDLIADMGVHTFFCVSSASEHPTEVVRFLRLYLAANTDGAPDNLPILEEDIDAFLRYYEDQTFIQNGDQSGVVYDRNAVGMPGFHYKLTKEDGDTFKALCNRVTKRCGVPSPVTELFYEEFYSRENKTYAEMLEIVQSRAEIYLTERN